VGLSAFFLLLIVASREMASGIAAAPPGPSRAAVFAALAAIVGHLIHGLTHFTFGSSWIQIGFYIALGLGIGEMLTRAGPRRFEGRRLEPRTIAWGLCTVAAVWATIPWLVSHPSAVAVLSVLAALDVGTRWALGEATVVEGALAASVAFVVVASFVLLALADERRDLALRVMIAGAAPFAVAHGSVRLAGLISSRPQSSS
jgi:hypothetical protein